MGVVDEGVFAEIGGHLGSVLVVFVALPNLDQIMLSYLLPKEPRLIAPHNLLPLPSIIILLVLQICLLPIPYLFCTHSKFVFFVARPPVSEGGVGMGGATLLVGEVLGGVEGVGLGHGGVEEGADF